MDANNISPEETEIEKDRLIKSFSKALETHGGLDLTGYVAENTIIHKNHAHSGFVRSIAYKLKATGKFDLSPTDNKDQFFVYKLPEKAWKDKY